MSLLLLKALLFGTLTFLFRAATEDARERGVKSRRKKREKIEAQITRAITNRWVVLIIHRGAKGKSPMGTVVERREGPSPHIILSVGKNDVCLPISVESIISIVPLDSEAA